MKKLMILGASYSQIPLMQAARRLGYYTVAASIPGPYLGFGYADEVCYVDITDPEAVLKAAQEHQIQGICTCCMDIGLLAQGYVCSRMGLPGPSYETAQLCTNKYKMKEAFLAAGVNTARFFRISSPEELEPAMEQLRFPLIIKAVDQMGSRGIFRCDTPEEVRANYQKSMAASRQSYCILEEFLLGQMFGVEAMLQHGKPVYIMPMNNDLRSGNPPFPIGHSVPWEHKDRLMDQLTEQVTHAAAALGCTDNPMDFDAMLVGDEIYFIEATARAGATGITDQVSIHYGIDYYEAIVLLAMGEDVSGFFTAGELTPNLTHLFASGGSGILQEIINPVADHEQIVDLSFNVSAGDEVRLMTNGRDRIGQTIIKGSSLEECYQLLKETIDQLSLDIKETDHAGIHRYPVL